jgi:hypothetical protein
MKKIFGIILVIAALVSCKKDSDTTPPTISTVAINGIIDSEHSLSSGGSFALSIVVSDNEELNQLKIDIHSAEDGHSHELTGGGNRGNDWEVFEIVNLSGKTMEITRNFTIPADQQGEWHLILKAIDKEGNEAQEILVVLDITSAFIPQFSLGSSNPEMNDEGEIEVSVGTQVTLGGSLSDSDGLIALSARLVPEGDEDGTPLWSSNYDLAGATNWDLSNVSFIVPETSGHHFVLILEARDILDYENQVELILHIE